LKTTLILLPGLNGTAGLFKPLLDSVQDHFVVLPVSYPTQQEMSYQELTAFVCSEIESVKGNFIILGESFSGPISLFVAEKKPQGLLGVILVATFIRAPNFRVGRFLPWTLGFTLTKPLYKLRLLLSKKNSQSLIAAISTEMQKTTPQVLASRIQAIFAVNATDSLRKCKIPVVYFRGTRDFVVPKKNMNEILSVRSNTKVVEFNAQHFLLQSEPEQAFVAIKRFEEECGRE